MRYEIAESGRFRSRTPQPDITGQWHLFSFTQRHYPILPCNFPAPGFLRYLKQSDIIYGWRESCGRFSFISLSIQGSDYGPNTTGHELWALLSRKILFDISYVILDQLEAMFNLQSLFFNYKSITIDWSQS